MISAICIYTNGMARLNESLACWLAQDFGGERELVIVNCQLRQRLKCDIEGVRLIQMTRQIMPPQARNMAIEATHGDVIASWPADDICLPNHLKNIAQWIEGRAWCWFDREFQMERGKIARLEQAGASSFAFTKAAWLAVGKYGFGVAGASDRNFIGKLTTKFTGEKVTLAPSAVSYIRCGTEAEKRLGSRMVVPGEIVLNPMLKHDYAELVRTFFGGKKDKKVGVVMLGRIGDIINILPFLKLIHDNYAKPYLVVGYEFASILEGVSYVEPHVLQFKTEDLGAALAIAKREYDIVINAQIWGKGWKQTQECESFNKESWRNCGLLHRFNDETLRPVFDRRDLEREAEMLAEIPDTGKPWLVVNFTGAISGPCPECAKLLGEVEKEWGRRYQIIDIMNIKVHRLYDFIGLFEKAAALISIDTAFLHLAAATNIPVVAIVRPKWAGTTMRMNCVAQIVYDDAVKNPQLVHDAIEKAVFQRAIIACPDAELVIENYSTVLDKPIERRVFHACDRHDETDPKVLERKKVCHASWDVLYGSEALIPAHYWDTLYVRNAKDGIGDRRRLPFFKDLLKHTMKQMDDDDILLWTNDDNCILPRLPEYLKFHLSVFGPCSILRTEFMGRIPSLELSPEQFDKGSRFHVGRDGFAFTKRWLVENWDKIPDFICGASDFDLVLACLIRLEYGIKSTGRNLGEQIFPAEIPRGYLGHVQHHSTWNTRDVNSVPSNIHNRKLFREMRDKYLPELKLTVHNTLA